MSDYKDQVEILHAALYARVAHAATGQKRKYTNEPYFVHPQEVANIIRSIGGCPDMIKAAYLHDVVEDTAITIQDIKEEFGYNVAYLVNGVTDTSKPEDGNRAERKRIDRDKFRGAPGHIKSIKLADLISNTTSIVAHDPKFAKVYLAEKLELLEVLRGGDEGLWERAHKLAVEGLAQIEKEAA